MFKQYKDLCDVVSLLVYCPNERAYLFTKEASGETWLPSSKCEKNCWKMTAQKIYFGFFGVDSSTSCHPIRVYKIWLPNHALQCVYHAVYKAVVKTEIKKRMKNKAGLRSRLQWLNAAELERQRAHSILRSPEILLFSLMVIDEGKDSDKDTDIESGALVEICEANVVVGIDVAGGAVAMASPNLQLLQAAGYNRDDLKEGECGLRMNEFPVKCLLYADDQVLLASSAEQLQDMVTLMDEVYQIRMYREFVLMVFPALYMSVHVFSQFMIDLGWQRSQCQNLFRSADVTGRGGLSFLELMLWTAALEPATQHSGVPAEIRCKYIFRYFDNNRDQKLEYVEFKELVAAARAARQLPIDALSVAKDADVCLRQLGMQPNSQLPMAEFLRGVAELRLRGTSSLLRSPRSICAYIMDLQERDKECRVSTSSTTKLQTITGIGLAAGAQGSGSRSPAGAGAGSAKRAARPDFRLAAYTVRMRLRPPNELIELNNFDEDAMSPSTTRLMAREVQSFDIIGPSSMPVEALAAVHYFASSVDKPHNVRRQPVSSSLNTVKPAWAWSSPAEEAALGSLLLRLAEAVLPIFAAEPRLLRLASPVYAIGDLHGNLSALLSMESALWPSGTALAAARILFLGDYVDRGSHGTELIAYLLAAKLQRPNAVLMVRGNHEIRDIQRMFTFYNECIGKYGDNEGAKIWNAINNVFDCLPLAAVIDDKVFCCHGGIPPPWVCPLITAIDKVPVPLPRPAEQSSIAWELLWNDPIKMNKITATLHLELVANEGFAANAKRGTGHVFDQSALDRFLLANQLSHVVRAHELHQNGFMCQLRGKLTSVFSSFHYCGGTNDAGIALLEDGKLRLMRLNYTD